MHCYRASAQSDGFLASSPTRVNANGVDLNRNFPTKDWQQKRFVNGLPRGKSSLLSGAKPASEQETLFQMALIKRFNPQKNIIAHSPLNFFDYDGPSSDLNSFEQWMNKYVRNKSSFE